MVSTTYRSGPIALHWAAHEAFLDVLTGEGLLVLPRPEDDLSAGGTGLHEAEWGYVVRELDALGWEPSEDECGGLCHNGYTVDGREVVGLYGRDPIHSQSSIDQAAESVRALAALAGLSL